MGLDLEPVKKAIKTVVVPKGVSVLKKVASETLSTQGSPILKMAVGGVVAAGTKKIQDGHLFLKTRAMLDKILQDINSLIFVSTILINILFSVFYAVSIISNVHNILLLCIYSVLALLSLVSFIYFIKTYNYKSKLEVKDTKKVFQYSKYIVNTSVIVVKLIDFCIYGANLLNLSVLIISAIFLAFQIILEIISLGVKFNIELLWKSFLMDIEPGMKTYSVLSDIPGTIIEAVDEGVNFVKNKIVPNSQKVDKEPEKMTRSQKHKKQKEERQTQIINERAEEFKKKLDEEKLQKEQDKKQKREHHLDNIKHSVSDIVNGVFKKK